MRGKIDSGKRKNRSDSRYNYAKSRSAWTQSPNLTMTTTAFPNAHGRKATCHVRIPEQVRKAILASKGFAQLNGDLTLELSPERPLLNVPLDVHLTVPVMIGARNEWHGLAAYIGDLDCGRISQFPLPRLSRLTRQFHLHRGRLVAVNILASLACCFPATQEKREQPQQNKPQTLKSVATKPTPAEPAWAVAMKESATVGEVRAKITSVRIGRAKFEDTWNHKETRRGMSANGAVARCTSRRFASLQSLTELGLSQVAAATRAGLSRPADKREHPSRGRVLSGGNAAGAGPTRGSRLRRPCRASPGRFHPG